MNEKKITEFVILKQINFVVLNLVNMTEKKLNWSN